MLPAAWPGLVQVREAPRGGSGGTVVRDPWRRCSRARGRDGRLREPRHGCAGANVGLEHQVRRQRGVEWACRRQHLERVELRLYGRYDNSTHRLRAPVAMRSISTKANFACGRCPPEDGRLAATASPPGCFSSHGSNPSRLARSLRACAASASGSAGARRSAGRSSSRPVIPVGAISPARAARQATARRLKPGRSTP